MPPAGMTVSKRVIKPETLHSKAVFVQAAAEAGEHACCLLMRERWAEIVGKMTSCGCQLVLMPSYRSPLVIWTAFLSIAHRHITGLEQRQMALAILATRHFLHSHALLVQNCSELIAGVHPP